MGDAFGLFVLIRPSAGKPWGFTRLAVELALLVLARSAERADPSIRRAPRWPAYLKRAAG
jgi:hypothetical protein